MQADGCVLNGAFSSRSDGDDSQSDLGRVGVGNVSRSLNDVPAGLPHVLTVHVRCELVLEVQVVAPVPAARVVVVEGAVAVAHNSRCLADRMEEKALVVVWPQWDNWGLLAETIEDSGLECSDGKVHS